MNENILNNISDSDLNINDKYFNISDSDLDNLLFGITLTVDKIDNTRCFNCKSNELLIDNIKGNIVCHNCGVINKECIDENPDNMLNDNDTASRYGAPSSILYPRSCLGTKIVGNNRLSMLQSQGQMPYKEKSLMEVCLDKIQRKCELYGISQSIIECAKILYKKVSEIVHSKGKRKGKHIIMRCINRRAMIAACLFHACKIQSETRTTKEIADIYDLEIKHVNCGCRKFCDIIDPNTLFFQIQSSKCSDFIERNANKLNIEQKYIDKSIEVANNIHKLDIASTHEPPSIAAGCILLVCEYYHIPLSKKEIAHIFNISDVTISKTYNKISKFNKIVLSNTIMNLIMERKNNQIILNNDNK